MAIAHIKGMTKFSLVLRGPKQTAVVAACFPPFSPSLLRSPLSLLLHTPSMLLPTLPPLLPKQSPLLPTVSTLPAVFAVAVLLAVLNIIPCHCYHHLHPPCRSGNEVVVKDNSCYWSPFNADGHCAFKIYRRYGSVLVTAILADKFHWTVWNEPIGNGNATAFWYKPVIQFRFEVIEYTRPRLCPRSCISDNPSSSLHNLYVHPAQALDPAQVRCFKEMVQSRVSTPAPSSSDYTNYTQLWSSILGRLHTMKATIFVCIASHWNFPHSS